MGYTYTRALLASQGKSAPVEAPKRGRGRGRGSGTASSAGRERAPPKDRVPRAGHAVPSTENVPQRTEKKRGRPKATPQDDALKSSSTSDSITPPKKRGRLETITPNDNGQLVEIVPIEKSTTKIPAKKSGQPSKKAVVEIAPAKNKLQDAAIQINNAAQRPVGRPRKIAAKPAPTTSLQTNISKKKSATTSTVAGSTPLPLYHSTYRLKHAVRRQTQTLEEDDDREHLNIWACEFEPHQGPNTSNTVALCTENLILFLDVIQGKYIKKYTHPEPLEIFYALAWTTLEGADDFLDSTIESSCNILAAAGASDDMTIRLWDIGTPTSKTDNSTCLAKFMIPSATGVPTAISLSPDMSRLAVGCDSGDMALYNIDQNVLKKMESAKEITTFKSHTLYPAGDEWHEGYIDDIHILDGGNGDLANCVVSRGSSDQEILVWNPKTSSKTDADIVMSLMWPDADDVAGVRFKVLERSNEKAIIAGDYEGQIHIFNIGDGKKSKTLEDGTKERFPATKAVIRDICVSMDTRILVAVDSESTVFVWVCV
ncbi:hypothetical protein EC973_001288 [Apophysomyces ossiformis]|uniref:WD40 repeat-like protein n=1 Tax=Apophysomyces ossiformis TaxID=679940 RepID=A0A8H7BQC7_9FUNG|nr:hypothetical protein EC973_001288 [Apophysomyces ossiformis]